MLLLIKKRYRMNKKKVTNTGLAKYIGKNPSAISYKKRETPKEYDLMMAGFRLFCGKDGEIIEVKIDGKKILTKIVDKDVL